MKKLFITFLILPLMALGCGQKEKTVPEQALEKAKTLFEEARKNGNDVSNGPCLSNGLFDVELSTDQWVVDIAHDPRIELDNYPINQCSAYITGDAKHFVELDTNGNLVKYY